MKQINRNIRLRQRVACRVLSSLLFALAGFSGEAWSGSFDLENGLTGQYTMTFGYSLALRTERPADALVNGPIDAQTGLPTTINYDDGDRNFKQGSLINNRATALGELALSWRDYGVELRGDGFYDDVYHHRNDNDSPETVNKSGAHDQFTAAAKKFSGGRARLLDAYVYGNWMLGNMQLDLRLGRQLVAWGEGLFFGNIAFAQSTADATKANIPGVDVKSILLPVEQVAANFGLTDDLSLMGYYHLRYKPLELEPVGAYFSTVDILGPGAQFAYGFVNPLYDPLADPCPLVPAPANQLPCVLPSAPGVAPGVVPQARRIISLPRGPDLLPSNGGQWGVGLKYQLTPSTNLGLYWLRYHDTLPAVRLNPGTTELATGVTTTAAPVSYNITYFDGIKLGGASFSTKLGRANVAGEVIYRDGVNLLVKGRFGPTSTRGEVGQAFLSTIYLVPPNFVSQQIDLVGEVGYLQVLGVQPVEDSAELVNSHNSWGYAAIANFNYRNVFAKWDLAVPVTVAQIVKGKPAMAGAMGSLYGEGDLRASVGANFTYLQNLQLAASYNAFLGSPDLNNRPYADRDYAAVNVKYSF